MLLSIDLESKEPIYLQIRNGVVEGIASGKLKECLLIFGGLYRGSGRGSKKGFCMLSIRKVILIMPKRKGTNEEIAEYRKMKGVFFYI